MVVVLIGCLKRWFEGNSESGNGIDQWNGSDDAWI